MARLCPAVPRETIEFVSIGSLALVSPYALDAPGGVQGQVRGLALEMTARDWLVSVAAPGPANDEALLAAGIELISLGASTSVRANGSRAPLSFHLGQARSFARACEARSVDIVHVHEPLAPVASWPLLARHKIPILATFHRSGIDALSSFAGVALRRLVRNIDDAVAVSDAAATTLRDTCGIDSTVLFNGIDLTSLESVKASPTTGPTVLFLGRDEPRKGRRVLLDAAPLLGRDVTIWVTGKREPVESSGARVEFLGHISEEEKMARLRAADVLCAPSLGGESFGIVLLEGLASGCAVVASAIDGYEQALNGHGILVTPNDPVALSEGVRQALALDSQGVDQERRAYLEHWSMGNLAGIYEQRYRALISARSSEQRG